MTQIVKLCNWEQNGYHDSYFYDAVYDVDADEISGIQIGSTAYGGGPERFPQTDDEGILVKAYIKLENLIRKKLFQNALVDYNEPGLDLIVNGMTLVTKQDVKSVKRIKDICKKCSGSTHWINPNNNADKRVCFSCSGRGFFVKPDAENKSVWNRIKQGEVITVIESKTRGVFYKNGYNKPDRTNTTITGYCGSEIVTIKLQNLMLSGKEPIEESFRNKAHSLACEGQFQTVTNIRCAWLSQHYAPCPDSFKNMQPQEVI